MDGLSSLCFSGDLKESPYRFMLPPDHWLDCPTNLVGEIEKLIPIDMFIHEIRINSFLNERFGTCLERYIGLDFNGVISITQIDGYEPSILLSVVKYGEKEATHHYELEPSEKFIIEIDRFIMIHGETPPKVPIGIWGRIKDRPYEFKFLRDFSDFHFE